MSVDLEPFFDRVRALFPDTRGHGLSSRFEHVDDYIYARKATDLLLWLEKNLPEGSPLRASPLFSEPWRASLPSPVPSAQAPFTDWLP